MHAYVVYAHPSGRSFSRSVLERFAAGLEAAGHSFEVGDLYAMGFQCEMDEAQYLRETGLDPEAPVPDDVREEQRKLGRADALVFIFPLWWSDCPAKLKGWFDRVLTHGFAYFYDSDNQRHTRITVKKALVLCSAGHTAEHLEEIHIAEAMRTILLQDRLLGVGVGEARLEILGGMMPGQGQFQDQNLARVYELGRTL